MLQIPTKIKPVQGFSHLLHFAFTILLPILAYILVRIDFVSIAIALILLSKWRIVAVRPRYWIVNLISNGIDITVAVSFVLFMANTSSVWWQLIWVLAYILWLVSLKPRSNVLSVSAQAMVGQLLGLAVLYIKFGDTPLAVLMAGTWAITYLAARHFLSSFEEAHPALLAHAWAYFSASLAFVLGHWLLFYGSIAQIIVILTTIGYGIAALYYLDATNKLTALLRRQLVGIMCAILLIVVVFADWTGATL